jgi:hypothetical protein
MSQATLHQFTASHLFFLRACRSSDYNPLVSPEHNRDGNLDHSLAVAKAKRASKGSI